MNKVMLSTVISSMMERIVGRPVSVNFAHLGATSDYTIAIQKSLFEFTDEEGPVGTMYVTFNSAHLSNVSNLIKCINQVLDSKGEAL